MIKIRFEVDTHDGRRVGHTATHPTLPRVGEFVHLPIGEEHHTQVTAVHHVISDSDPWPGNPDLSGVQAMVYSAPPKR